MLNTKTSNQLWSKTMETYATNAKTGEKYSGEKGTNIFRPVKIPTGEIYKDTGEPKFKSVPKWWSVFNEEQTTEIVVN